MRILILGGTVFLGRWFVELAREAGHEVVLFHRGRSNPGLFPDCEHVIGDRADGMAALAGREFDAVVDTSGNLPQHVEASIDALANSVTRYLFVSSISVYAPPLVTGVDESAPVVELEPPYPDAMTPESYGGLKAACENAVRGAFPDTHLVIRPGLIVGPHDPTDRFTYWPERLARGGRVLCPPDLEQRVQWIDVRDLALWMVRLLENGFTGTLNAAGPAERCTFGEMLARIEGAARPTTPVELVSRTAEILAEHEVAPWMGLPLWVPPEIQGLLDVDLTAAVAAGLSLRPLAETAEATLAWARTVPDRKRPAGISAEVEARALRA